MYKKVNPKLIEYMEKEIFPIYRTFDKGHDLKHIKSVISRAFELAEGIDNLDANLVYASAALHDIGIQVERKHHALHSAEFVRNNSKLKEFFSEDEIKILSEAVEDHSTSRGVEPRSIYGKIVCDADKDNNIEISLLRAYEFTKRYFPNYTVEECYKNVFEQLQYKFGKQGKVRYWINSQKQQDFMKSMHELAQDENKFNSFLTKVIKKNEIKEIEDSEIR